MTSSLFIRTYDKDARWLRYCLRSLDKFASGFSQKVIVTPMDSHDAIHPLAVEFDWQYDCCELLAKDDYVGQQGTKMMADTWCSGDIICFIDSDLVFLRPFTPGCVVNEAWKIPILKTRYDTIECPWQSITENTVGFPVEWEYMRRFPLSYPRELFDLTRNHIERTHGIDFKDFMWKVKGRHLSEFNILGAIAEKFMPERFDMIDTNSGAEFPPLYAKQFWSWGGVTSDIEKEIETILQ